MGNLSKILGCLFIVFGTCLKIVKTQKPPTIEFIYGNNKFIPSEWNTSITFNTTFRVGSPDQNILNLNERSAGLNYLYLRCTANYPIRWLTHKPQGSITYSYEKRFFRTAGQPVPTYYQHVFVKLDEDFSRILRCQSFKDTKLAADIFLQSFHNINMSEPDTLVFETTGSNYFEVIEGETPVVPCAAKVFNSVPSKMNLTQRNSQADIFSDNCAICSCYAASDCPNDTFPCFSKNICGLSSIKALWDDVNPDYEQDDCERNFGCSTCTIQGHMQKFRENGTDCDRDGILSCVDYALQTIVGNADCSVEIEGRQKIIQDRFMECFVQANESPIKVDEDTMVYDPRIGFTHTPAINLTAMYQCSSSLYNTFFMTPLSKDWETKAHFNISHVNNAEIRIKCIPQAPVSNLDIQIGSCGSINECDFKYKGIEPYIPFPQSSSSDSSIQQEFSFNQSEGVLAKITTGYVQCSAVFSPAGDPNVFGYVYKTDYIFLGLEDNTKTHFLQDYDVNKTIKLKNLTEKLKPGTVYDFTCDISTFVLLPDVFFKVKKTTDDEAQELVSAENKEIELIPEPPGNFSQRFILRMSVTSDMVSLSCWAPQMRTDGFVVSEIPLDFEDDFVDIYIYVGVTVATAVFVMMAVSIGTFWHKYQKSKERIRDLNEREMEEFLFGDKNAVGGSGDELNIESYGFSKEKYITKDRITIYENKVLGEGFFGLVLEATFDDETVAVKTTKSNTDVEYFKAFLKEVKLMDFIGDHDNIVKFHGAVVDNIQGRVCYAVIELSPFGNLHGFLQKHSGNYVGGENSGKKKLEETDSGFSIAFLDEPRMELNQSILVSFCRQIASGMEFLSERRVIHGDLATRNVLVFPNNIVKVTDFGLAKKLYDLADYVKDKQKHTPWRWMALESLRFHRFFTNSDVWSFAVTIWEIFSFAEVPFAGLDWSPDFVDQIEGGMRLKQPKQCLPEIYDWMNKCWQNEAEDRPTFCDCKAFFINIQSKVNKDDMIYGCVDQV